MTSYVAWNEIRAEHVGRAGGEAAVEAGKREVLAEVIGHRLAGIRRTRGLTQQQVADRMGVTKGRVSQIETRQDLWTGRPGPLRHRPRRPTPPGNLLRRRRHHCPCDARERITHPRQPDESEQRHLSAGTARNSELLGRRGHGCADARRDPLVPSLTGIESGAERGAVIGSAAGPVRGVREVGSDPPGRTTPRGRRRSSRSSPREPRVGSNDLPRRTRQSNWG